MKRLVLAGGGHAQLLLLQALAAHRPANMQAVLVSPSRYHTYSGMVPGWISGHFALNEIRVDALGDRHIPVRPLAYFISRWRDVVREAEERRTFRLVVVGGGSAGVELALAARHAASRIRKYLPLAMCARVSMCSGCRNFQKQLHVLRSAMRAFAAGERRH